MTAEGELRSIPEGWVRVPAQDARVPRLLAAGPAWCVTTTRGRSCFTNEVWVPAERLEPHVAARQDPALVGRLADLLDFAPRHRALGLDMARAVAGALQVSPLPDGGRSLDAAALRVGLFRWLDQHLEGGDLPRRNLRAGVERRRKRALSILDEYRIGLPRNPRLCPLARALAASLEA